MDYKAFAKSMRENKVTDEKGIILCSPDLWEEIAKIIENIDEAKHATWIDKNDEYGRIYCSSCSAEERPGDSQYKSPRCPICGAIMKH